MRRWWSGECSGRVAGGNAAYWRKLAGPDDDLFLELVSFAETQLYLRIIAAQADHYRSRDEMTRAPRDDFAVNLPAISA